MQRYTVTREDRKEPGATNHVYRLAPVERLPDGTLAKSFLANVTPDSAAAKVLDAQSAEGEVPTVVLLNIQKGKPPYIVEAMPAWTHDHGLEIKEKGERRMLTGNDDLTSSCLQQMHLAVMREQMEQFKKLKEPAKFSLYSGFADQYVAAKLATDISELGKSVQDTQLSMRQKVLKSMVPAGLPVKFLPFVTDKVLMGLSSEAASRFPALEQINPDWEKAFESNLRFLGMNNEELKSFTSDFRKLDPASRTELVRLLVPGNQDILTKALAANKTYKAMETAFSGDKPTTPIFMGNLYLSGSDPVLVGQAANRLAGIAPGTALDEDTIKLLGKIAPKAALNEGQDFSTKDSEVELTPSGVKLMEGMVRNYQPDIAIGLAKASEAGVVSIAEIGGTLGQYERARSNLTQALAAHQAGYYDKPASIEAVLGSDRGLEVNKRLGFQMEGKQYTWTPSLGCTNETGAPVDMNAVFQDNDGRTYAIHGRTATQLLGPEGLITTANGREIIQNSNGTVGLVEATGQITTFASAIEACEQLGDDSFVGTDKREYVVKEGKVVEKGVQRYNTLAGGFMDTLEPSQAVRSRPNADVRSHPAVDFYRQKALQETLAHQTISTAADAHLALVKGDGLWLTKPDGRPVLTVPDENFFWRNDQGNLVPRRDFVNMQASMGLVIANHNIAHLAGMYGKTTTEGPGLNSKLLTAMERQPDLMSATNKATGVMNDALEAVETHIDSVDGAVYRQYGELKAQKVRQTINRAGTGFAALGAMAVIGAMHELCHSHD